LPGSTPFAKTSAFGFALPMSSEARMSIRRAMNFGSSPPSIIRASQYTEAFGSLPRIDLINAEMISYVALLFYHKVQFVPVLFLNYEFICDFYLISSGIVYNKFKKVQQLPRITTTQSQ
jgi:hypothetical protein